jgi:imidazolonepropionase
MPFMIALAVREMGLTPAQALYAATAGAATSLRRSEIGRIVVGGRADLAVIDAPSHLHLAYRPGVPLVRAFQRVARARSGGVPFGHT